MLTILIHKYTHMRILLTYVTKRREVAAILKYLTVEIMLSIRDRQGALPRRIWYRRGLVLWSTLK